MRHTYLAGALGDKITSIARRALYPVAFSHTVTIRITAGTTTVVLSRATAASRIPTFKIAHPRRVRAFPCASLALAVCGTARPTRHGTAATVLGAKLSNGVFELKEFIVCRLSAGPRRKRECFHRVLDFLVELRVGVPLLGLVGRGHSRANQGVLQFCTIFTSTAQSQLMRSIIL